MPLSLTTRIGLALTLGVLATFAFAPFDQHWLLPLVLAALFLIADGRSFWRAAGYGWLFGVANFTSGIYWTFISTHYYGGAPAVMAVLLCAVLFSYMAIYPALAIGLAAWLGLFRRPIGWLGIPALWMLGELLRGWVYSGFPWLSLGYAALDTPLTNLAPLFGVYFISSMIALMALAAYRLVWIAERRWISAIVLVTPLATGLLLPKPGFWARDTGAPMNIAIVQGDVEQGDKFKPAMRKVMLDRHRNMTQAAFSGKGPKPDLLLWPESALPMSLQGIKADYLDDLRQMLRAEGASLIFGSVVVEQGETDDDEKFYNSAIAIGVTEARYDKRHLVPFGEYFPIPDFLRPLMVWLGTNYEDMASGAANQPLFTVRGEKIFIGICFEDVFGSEFRHDGREANLLVNLTNDAWFGHSPAPFQHLQFSRMRAIEYSRWLARSTTTGISAFIDADGTVLSHSGEFDQELLRGSVQPRAGATLYTRIGDMPLWVASGLVSFALVFFEWRRRRKAP